MKGPAFQQGFNFSIVYQSSRISVQKRNPVFRRLEHPLLASPESTDHSLSYVCVCS
jgi:hypothetical protein